MSKDVNTVVSVVVALNNDEELIEGLLRDLDAVLRANFDFFEVIVVDDASKDATRSRIDCLLGSIERVRYLRLSRNFGIDVALSAGIESALGDVVVTMDPRTDPIDRIPHIVRKCRESGGVVHGVCSELASRGPLRELMGTIFRGYCRRFLGVPLSRGAADFRAMSRAAVNALLQVKLQNRYLRVLTATLGYEQSELRYDAVRRGQGRREYSLVVELGTGLDLVAAHTRHPLRFVTWSGVGAATLCGLYALYALVVYFVKDDVAEGWTTTSLILSGMFFLLFVTLAVLGEYVGTILNEVRGRPLYFVAEEKNSSVLMEDTVETSLVGDSRDQS